MIRTLLRPPRGAEILADGVRVLSVASVVVAAVGWGPRDVVSIAFAALVTLLPRLLGLRPAVDVAVVVVVMVATWSGVLGIYSTALWWDLPVHVALNALLAAVAYIVLVRLRVLADADSLPRPVLSAAVTTTAVGLALGVLWELVEWFVKTFIDSGTLVGYEDTLGDLVVGGLGSLAAGCAMRFIAGDPRTVPPRVSAASPGATRAH